MRRRDFITLVGGAAVWPRAARAQQSSMPVVGILQPGSPEVYVHFMEAFRRGLGEGGYVEGKNVVLISRWPQTDSDRLTEFATELVNHHVAVIATPFSLPASLAAKASTATIPIVFGTGADPVEAGLVARLNRPGSNITGVSVMSVELGAKRFGLLRELLPNALRFNVLVNPKSPLTKPFIANLQAEAAGWQYEILTASTNLEIDLAFANLVREHADALLISGDALGWIEERDVLIDFRFTGANSESIRRGVTDLIKSAPEIILSYATPGLAAVRRATTTIPIVFVNVTDPVGQGVVPSLAHPGVNITGFSFIEPEMVGKWINLLSDVKPRLSRVALMFNPDTAPFFDPYYRSFKAAPQQSAVEVEVAHVRTAGEIVSAIAKLGSKQGSALILGSDIFLATRASRSLGWRMSAGCRPFPLIGNSPSMEVWSPMGPILATSAGAQVSTCIAFSRVSSREICQCNHPSDSTSLSI
jgi:putative tryptophan/tyrosine transport system substrate-binding protein